jgi:hypothetical protein
MAFVPGAGGAGKIAKALKKVGNLLPMENDGRHLESPFPK